MNESKENHAGSCNSSSKISSGPNIGSNICSAAVVGEASSMDGASRVGGGSRVHGILQKSEQVSGGRAGGRYGLRSADPDEIDTAEFDSLRSCTEGRLDVECCVDVLRFKSCEIKALLLLLNINVYNNHHLNIHCYSRSRERILRVFIEYFPVFSHPLFCLV